MKKGDLISICLKQAPPGYSYQASFTGSGYAELYSSGAPLGLQRLSVKLPDAMGLRR